MRYLTSLLLLFANTAFAQPMQFTLGYKDGRACSRDCPLVFATGDIVDTTPSLFDQMELGNAQTVVFHSVGGAVEPALELGRLIRKKRLRARIGTQSKQNVAAGVCKGACAWAFLGGTQRSLGQSERSQLVFERPNHMEILTSLTSRSLTAQERLGEQIVIGLLINYLSEVGVSTELYARIAKLKAGATYVPTKSDLSKFFIVRKTPEWRLEYLNRGLVLLAPSPQGQPSLRAFCYGPTESLRLHFAFETARVDAIGNDHQACIDKRCLSSSNLKSLGSDLSLSLDGQTYPAGFGGMFADPMNQAEIVVDFALSRAVLHALLQSSGAELSLGNKSVSSLSISHRDLAATNDDRLIKLLLRNCVQSAP